MSCPSCRPSRRAFAQRVRVRERRDARSQQAGFWFGCHAVPTEMRDPHLRRQPATGLRDYAESRDSRRLLARLAQHLHTEADTEQRRAARCVIANDGVESAGAQGHHAGAKRAYTRQNDPCRITNDCRIGRDDRRHAQTPERARNRREVCHARINDHHGASPWWTERRRSPSARPPAAARARSP